MECALDGGPRPGKTPLAWSIAKIDLRLQVALFESAPAVNSMQTLLS